MPVNAMKFTVPQGRLSVAVPHCSALPSRLLAFGLLKHLWFDRSRPVPTGAAGLFLIAFT
jgi:hypothetical protein